VVKTVVYKFAFLVCYNQAPAVHRKQFTANNSPQTIHRKGDSPQGNSPQGNSPQTIHRKKK
jgi:hypothetical protein